MKPPVFAELVRDVDDLSDDALEHLVPELLLITLALEELKVDFLQEDPQASLAEKPDDLGEAIEQQ